MAENGTALFSMAYKAKAMSLMKVRSPSPCCLHFNEIFNDDLKRCKLNFLIERRDES